MKNGKQLKITTDRRTYKLITTINPDDYWSDGLSFYQSKGRKRRPLWKKEKTTFEYRKYRTWKYNRKTQWLKKI